MKTLTLTTTALIAALAVPTLAAANPTAQAIFERQAANNMELYLQGSSSGDAGGIFQAEARSSDEFPYPAAGLGTTEVISTQSYSTNATAARIFAQQRAVVSEAHESDARFQPRFQP